MTAAAKGWAQRVAVAASGTPNFEFEFVSCDVHVEEVHVSTDGVDGRRDRHDEDTVEGIRRVTGQLVFKPTPLSLIWWLERCLGAAPSGNNFALADTLPTFVLATERVLKVHTYSGMKVDTARIRSSKGNDLEFVLDLEGLDESVGAAGTFPATTITYEQPYIHHQSVLTLDSVAREVDPIEIIIAHNLNKERFENSVTRVELPEGRRTIDLTAGFPYITENQALEYVSIAGIAGTCAWTNGADSFTVSMPNLKSPRRTPTNAGPDSEFRFQRTFRAHRTGATGGTAAFSAVNVNA